MSNVLAVQDQIGKEIARLQQEIDDLVNFTPDSIFDEAAKLGIEEFSWTQYTPHFNDGEPCTFWVNECQGFVIDGEEYDYDYDFYDYVDGERQYLVPNGEDILGFCPQQALGLNDNLMQQIFGDGYKITVDVKDRSISVEDYDHD